MIEELVNRLPLFASLPASEISNLVRTLQPCDMPAQTLLFREGASGDDCYILVEGQVEILKALETGDERLLGVRSPVTLLGEMSLFSHDNRRTASVRAQTPLRLLRMTRADFDALLQRHPRMAYELVRVMSTRLHESENLTIRDLQEKNRQLKQAYDELKSAHEQIVEKEKLERELAVARRIQRSILPHALPRVPGLDLGAQMVPTRSVGGDFYDFIPLGDRKLGIAVGDVSDKGVPAALFMSLTYSLLRVEARRCSSPAETLRAVNRSLLDMNGGGMFVTALYGILDAGTREFHYARAGHELPLVQDAQGSEITVPVAPGQPLGLFKSAIVDEGRVTIPPGGALFVYTDGVTDAMDPGGDFYGLERLVEILRANRAANAAGLCQAVWNSIVSFAGTAAQHDDVTLLALRAE
jgi:phosphoserine phosphatase RsbU/P